MAHSDQEDAEMVELSIKIGSVCNGQNPMIVMGALLTMVNNVIETLPDKHIKIAFADGAAASCIGIKNRLTN